MKPSELNKRLKKYSGEARKIRENLHRDPELSFKEKKTAAYISALLNEKGVEHYCGIGGNGILAVLNGKSKGHVVALRADMDALPLNEENNVPYRSRNKGVMHACGHDFHTASLLAVIMFFADNPSLLKGTLLGVFQPAEEKSPGGAIAMIKDGVFKKYKPEMMIAIHAFPDLPAGQAGFRAGYYMASSDELYITVTGKGGHGALVHKLNDPVLAAAHLLVATEQVNSRMNKAGNPSVLSFGKFVANGAVNIIPDKVEIAGTVRAMDEKWRKKVHTKLKEICKGISLTFDVKAELKIVPGYPSLYNDPIVTGFAHYYAKEFLGKNNAVELEEIRMTAEDFSYFAQQVPSCMFRVGTAFGDERTTYPLHSAKFDINEKAYPVSVGLLAYMVIKFMSRK